MRVYVTGPVQLGNVSFQVTQYIGPKFVPTIAENGVLSPGHPAEIDGIDKSMLNGVIVSKLLGHVPSSTFMVQVLYVSSSKVSNTIVLLHDETNVLIEVHGTP